MTSRGTKPKLAWKLLTKKRTSSTQGVPPGKEHLAYVTNTATLIYGERDAVLVDTFLSEEHARELADRVAESGKNLTTIDITHVPDRVNPGSLWAAAKTAKPA